MPRGYRNWIFAALGSAGFAAVLLVAGYGYYEFKVATKDPYPYDQYQPARDARSPPQALPKQQRQREAYQPNCQQPQSHEDADLCAQWGAVKAVTETNQLTRLALNLATLGFIFAVLGALVGVVGTALIWLAWRQTRDSNRIARRDYGKARLEARDASKAAAAALAIAERNADAAARQVEVALQTSDAQLRPWLKAEVKSTVCKRLTAAENQCAIIIKIINAGVSPAFNAGISVASRVVHSEELTGSPSDLPIHLGQFAPIFTNDPMDYSTSFQPTLDEIRKVTDAVIASGNGMPIVVFNLKISYRAASSDKVRETAFRYVFYGPPGDVEWLSRDRNINDDVSPRFESRMQPQDIMT